MAIKDLIRRKDGNVPVRHRESEGDLFSLQREMNRLFDDFFHGSDMVPFEPFGRVAATAFSPKINVSETDKEIKVAAELPGMDEKDVVVELSDDVLTLSGEKKEEHEEKGKDWRRVEHSYGSFHRVIPLPARPDAGKAKAEFKKGVLTVTLPKEKGSQGKRKTIDIKTE